MTMLRVADVNGGEVWSSGRSGSMYFDLRLVEDGEVFIRLDPDGTWCVDTREVADGKLRDSLVEQARRRRTRDGVARIHMKEGQNAAS